MKPEDLQQRWQEQGEQAVAAIAQWRVAHPKATLAEIEQAVDEQMNRLRAQLIEQAAQASAATDSAGSQALMCEQCGQALQGVTLYFRVKHTLSRRMASQADLLQAHEKG